MACPRCLSGRILSFYEELRCYACGYTVMQQEESRMPHREHVILEGEDISEQVFNLKTSGVDVYSIAMRLDVTTKEVRRRFKEQCAIEVEALWNEGLSQTDIMRELSINRYDVQCAITANEEKNAIPV